MDSPQSIMSRIIKFRAWSIENKKMYPVDEFTCNWNRSFITNKSELVIKKDDVLMQFTGLLDSEGKEIWEHDIVECTALSTTHTVIVEDIRHIPIEITGWKFSYTDFKCKVIGNLFEHPNLLNNE